MNICISSPWWKSWLYLYFYKRWDLSKSNKTTHKKHYWYQTSASKHPTSLPGSCDQWRYPCWMALVLHTRRRCYCGWMGWLRGHRWTGRRRCWAVSASGSLAARRAPTSWLPYAGDKAPENDRRSRRSTDHHECAISRLFAGYYVFVTQQ